MSVTKYFLPALLVASLAAAQSSDSFPREGGDWPHYLGPNYDGVQATGRLESDDFGLAVDWRRPLGSGYSAISVVGATGVTLTTDGSDDFAVAFDIATGAEIWRYRIAEIYPGHSGAEGGPRSTPAVADGRVYGLGPYGDLFALRLADGGEIWARRLEERIAPLPYFGFATSPVVVGEVVVVATGGAEGHSISAFDRRDGELRWSLGDDPASYTSPTLADLAGRRRLVVMNDRNLLGIDPATGKVLFEHPHGLPPQWASSTPLVLDGGRFLLTSFTETVLVRVTPSGDPTTDDSFAVEELWRTRAFRGAYFVPVPHEGYLYGFTGRFLTCVDASTGEVVWKSRPPGGNGLVRLDDYLLIAALSGELVVVAASPAGYREIARQPVFEYGSLTAPSVAGDDVFLRNLTTMARVKIIDTPRSVGAAAPAAARRETQRELLGSLGVFVRRVEAAASAQRPALVEEFLSRHETLPVVEDDGLVHFIYYGEALDVAMRASFLVINEEVSLDRIAGTDFYFKSFQLDPEGVHGYRFNVDFDQRTPDPKNPLRFSYFLGPMSELRMPQATVVDFDPEAELAGRLDSFQWNSDALSRELHLRVYLPPGYSDPRALAERYPFLVVFLGEEGVDGAHLDRLLDHLIVSGRVAPLIALILPRALGWLYAEQNFLPWGQAFHEEFLPHIETHYRLRAAAEDRAYYGPLDGGVLGLYWALQRPGTFGKVAIQSPVLKPPLADLLPPQLAAAATRPYIIVEKRRRDFDNRGDRVVREHTQRLLGHLAAAGYEVEVRELAGSWNWPSWRAQLGEILERFFPPPPPTQ